MRFTMNNYNNEKYFMMRIRGDFHYKTLNDLFKSFNLAKNKISYLIQNNCCYLNGDIATLETIIKQNDYLMVDISNFEQLDYIPEDKKIDILYEDEYLLIINKPAGYIIYPDDKNKTSTVANFVANVVLPLLGLPQIAMMFALSMLIPTHLLSCQKPLPVCLEIFVLSHYLLYIRV